MTPYLNTKEWIRSNQVAIMEYYLGVKVTSKLIRNPFRDDDNPTCGFYYGSAGSLYLHDFATDEHMDCITVVKKKYNLSYYKAVQLIQIEANNFQNNETSITETKKLEYIVGGSHNYFLKLGITQKTLDKYKVIHARALYINEDLYWRATPQNPIFIYNFPSGKFKAYRPLSKDKEKKWKSNCTNADIGGYLQLPKTGNILIVTSSIKDVMVLHEMGYAAISFNSEAIATRGQSGKEIEVLFNELKTRFNEIILFLDNDTAGLEYAKKVSRRFNLRNMTIPANLPKDISDVVSKYNFKKAKKLVNKLVRKCIMNNDTFDSFVTDTSLKENIFDERSND